MKLKFVILLLSVVFLASCSSSRYGYMPKAKKQAVVSKQFKKDKIKNIELATIKSATQNLDFNKPEVVLNQVENSYTKKTAAKKPATTVTVAPTAKEEINYTKQILKPNTVKELEKLENAKEVSKGSWLWYLIVGLLLLLVAGFLGGLIGSIFYIAGVVAVVISLLMLLGLI